MCLCNKVETSNLMKIKLTSYQWISHMARNHNGGTSSAGSMLSTWQSLMRSSDRPEPVIIRPPTMSSSAISASLTAVLDMSATL